MQYSVSDSSFCFFQYSSCAIHFTIVFSFICFFFHIHFISLYLICSQEPSNHRLHIYAYALCTCTSYKANEKNANLLLLLWFAATITGITLLGKGRETRQKLKLGKISEMKKKIVKFISISQQQKKGEHRDIVHRQTKCWCIAFVWI